MTTVDTQSTQTKEKKLVSRAEFEKEFEKEYCWLVRWEYMNPDEARVKARKAVSSELYFNQS